MKKVLLILIIIFAWMSSNAFAQYKAKGSQGGLNKPKDSYFGIKSHKAITDARSQKEKADPSENKKSSRYIKGDSTPQPQKINLKTSPQGLDKRKSKFSSDFGRAVDFKNSPLSPFPNTSFKTGDKFNSNFSDSKVKFKPIKLKTNTPQRISDPDSRNFTNSLPKTVFDSNSNDPTRSKPKTVFDSNPGAPVHSKPKTVFNSNYGNNSNSADSVPNPQSGSGHGTHSVFKKPSFDTKSKFNFGPAIKSKPKSKY